MSRLVNGTNRNAHNNLYLFCCLQEGLFWTHRTTGMSSSNMYALISVTVLAVDPLTKAVHAVGAMAKRFACFTRIQAFLVQNELVDVREHATSVMDAEKNKSTAAQIVDVCSVPDADGRQLFKNAKNIK